MKSFATIRHGRIRLPRRALIRVAIRRYEGHLRALRADRIPFSRANRLDVMARLAEDISADEIRDYETEAWGNTSDILRAIAASERGEVLTSLYAYDEDRTAGVTTAAYRQQWEDLARQLMTGDRRKRAAILMDLAGRVVGQPGVLVLDDVADTELAAAGDDVIAADWTEIMAVLTSGRQQLAPGYPALSGLDLAEICQDDGQRGDPS